MALSKSELDERIEELVDLIHSSCPYTKPCPVHNQGKRAIKELYRDCIKAVTPPVETATAWPMGEYETEFLAGRNRTIESIEANTKELLG